MGRRYCVFAANYLPNLGGVERYTLNLAKQLTGRGDEVTVVTSNVFGLPAEEEADGIRILRLPCLNLLKGRFPVFRPGAEARKLIRRLDETAFDFAIIQTRFYVHSALGARYAKKRKIPRIVIEHGTDHFTVNNALLDKAGHAYEHLVTAIVKHACTHFYGVSEACCKWLEHFHIRAEGILYNAVDPEGIRSAGEEAAADYRREYAPNGETVVCYAGRLVKEKGILKLTEAVEKLNREGTPTVLLVAGDGDLYDAVRQEDAKGVHALGRLDAGHVAALYRSSDIFCLPTDYPEGFPTSVLEAAACGCFVITTRNGGSQELILDDGYGIILKENTPEELAEAIRKAAGDSAYRAAAGEKARRRVEEKFTWRTVSGQVSAIAEQMIRDAGGARGGQA